MKERDFIKTVAGRHKNSTIHSEFLHKGIGDDCAVFGRDRQSKWLVSTDLLVENVHFLPHATDPYLLGRKSISVNLSDIAAMGGIPLFTLLSLSIPSHFDEKWLRRWNDGIYDILQEFTCQLIGGDTTKGDKLTINIMVLGTCETEKIVYRSNASAGQDVFVSGKLGLSSAGLRLILENQLYNQNYADLVQAHLDPIPQITAGNLLAGKGLAKAMQDISDGLSTDISHICCASEVGAVLFEDLLPRDNGLINFCNEYGLQINDLILNGGEDYQLVFTSEKRDRKQIEELAKHNGMRFYRVGEIRNRVGVFLRDLTGKEREITFSGFEHSH